MSEVRAQALSPNHLKTWSRCRRKYYYQYVLTLDWPTDQSNFRLGRAVHKLLEYEARQLDCTPLQASMASDVHLAWQSLSAHAMARLPVLASEWGFQVPIGDVWLTGRIDRIAKDGERVWVIDWKTGTATPKDPQNDWQTRAYLFAVVEAFQTPHFSVLDPEQLCFAYVEVKAGQVRETHIPYDRSDHERVRRQLEEVFQEIEAETDYPTPKQCPDRYCPYLTICGVGA